MKDALLETAARHGLLRPLDLHFARFVGDLAGDRNSGELRLAAALLSRLSGEGHVCMELAEVAGEPLFPDLEQEEPLLKGATAPGLDEWREALLHSGVVGGPEDVAPLILAPGNRLYLHRYWNFERRLAKALLQRAAEAPESRPEKLRPILDRLFPGSPERTDWQKVAAALAAMHSFAVISGGPGTGKTYTVSRVLALLIEQATPRVPRIALAAPTGKAAARLAESIQANLNGLDCPPAVKDVIPQQAVTLHRLLGSRPGRIGFRHDRGNPLHADVVLVDEASMVDLPLMARLVDALPSHARLILLGDKDQLASVEAGAVLGDICRRADGYSAAMAEKLRQACGTSVPADARCRSPLTDCIAVLRESRRFAEAPGIGALAEAINRGDGAATRAALENEAPWVSWRRPLATELPAALGSIALEHYRGYLAEENAQAALVRFNREFRILCALREGPFGVGAINRAVEEALSRAGLIRPSDPWYHGRPIIITRNDYSLRLFNGDIGLIWRDPAFDGRLRACFYSPDGGFVSLPPNRLPTHETVFAMTVHKSQGSEFDEVLMLLPDRWSPVLGRELLYTGITRARSRVGVWGDGTLLDQIVARRTLRRSGLGEALYGPEPKAAQPSEAVSARRDHQLDLFDAG